MGVAKSRHAFGSKERVAEALENGRIDAYDVVLMEGEDGLGEIGWVNKNGNLVLSSHPKEVKIVAELPETGDVGVLYVCGSKMYIWENSAFKALIDPEETAADTELAIEEALENALGVVEF